MLKYRKKKKDFDSNYSKYWKKTIDNTKNMCKVKSDVPVEGFVKKTERKSAIICSKRFYIYLYK